MVDLHVTWSGEGKEVCVGGTFTSWNPVPLTKEGDKWLGAFKVPPGKHRYQFYVDGKWTVDENEPTIEESFASRSHVVDCTMKHSGRGSLSSWSPNVTPRGSPLFTSISPSPIINALDLNYNDDDHLTSAFLARRSCSFGHLNTASRKRTGSDDFEGIHLDSTHSRNLQKGKLCIAMVGLPARGKTFISTKLRRYLSWLGHRTKTFNVGEKRRENCGRNLSYDFFDPNNKEAEKRRWDCAMQVLDELLEYLQTDGDVAIYDATNTTKRRRAEIRRRCNVRHVRVLFVESACDNSYIIEANIRQHKLHNMDYEGTDPDAAMRDFQQRIANYQKSYEPLDDSDHSFIKLVDVGRQIIGNNVNGYLPGRVMFYLTNLHIVPRTVFLTRHGESIYNTKGYLGGDSPLSDLGQEYAKILGEFIPTHLRKTQDEESHWAYGDPAASQTQPVVWTSTLRRTIMTSEHLPYRNIQWRALDEIDAGICDGMTYEEIKKSMPDVHAARKADKLRYRYPRGESYLDVIQRLEPVIVEMERQTSPLIIIAHQAVLRCLYGYLANKPAEELPHIDIPLHTLIELTPHAYGATEVRYNLLK
eukprot:Rmarinus@m.19836